MSEKPRKRLMNKSEYVRTKCAALIAYSVGAVLMIGGFFLPFTLLLKLGPWIVIMFPIMLVAGGLGYFAVKAGASIIRSTENREPIALITRHNTRHLSEVETLVRGSDLPPSHQQAELLRAAKPGQETPTEELLRATNASGPE